MTLILPVRAVHPATPRTRVITVDLGQHAFAFRAGQAVLAGLVDSTIRRPYSIACSPSYAARSGTIELLVQIDDHSFPDPHFERAVPGTRLRIDGPFGSFCLPSPVPESRLLLVAGGTGIAPLRSMMWDTLERTPECSISVLYSARAPEEFAFLDELATLSVAERIRLSLTVTRAADDTWTGTRGRIDERLVGAVLDTPETRCVVCGPPSFVADVSQVLAAAGVATEKIQRETYAAS